MNVVTALAVRHTPGHFFLVAGQMLPGHIRTLPAFTFAVDLLLGPPLRSTLFLSFCDAWAHHENPTPFEPIPTRRSISAFVH